MHKALPFREGVHHENWESSGIFALMIWGYGDVQRIGISSPIIYRNVDVNMCFCAGYAGSSC